MPARVRASSGVEVGMLRKGLLLGAVAVVVAVMAGLGLIIFVLLLVFLLLRK